MTPLFVNLGDIAGALGCANENAAMLAAVQALKAERAAALRQVDDLQAANNRYLARAREAERLLRLGEVEGRTAPEGENTRIVGGAR